MKIVCVISEIFPALSVALIFKSYFPSFSNERFLSTLTTFGSAVDIVSIAIPSIVTSCTLDPVPSILISILTVLFLMYELASGWITIISGGRPSVIIFLNGIISWYKLFIVSAPTNRFAFKIISSLETCCPFAGIAGDIPVIVVPSEETKTLVAQLVVFL